MAPRKSYPSEICREQSATILLLLEFVRKRCNFSTLREWWWIAAILLFFTALSAGMMFTGVASRQGCKDRFRTILGTGLFYTATGFDLCGQARIFAANMT